MTTQQVNPSLFATLPEHIQAKILYLATNKSFNKEHRQSVFRERIENAKIKPFVKEELSVAGKQSLHEWLLGFRREVLIPHIQSIDVSFAIYTRRTNNMDNMTVTGELFLTIEGANDDEIDLLFEYDFHDSDKTRKEIIDIILNNKIVLSDFRSMFR